MKDGYLPFPYIRLETVVYTTDTVLRLFIVVSLGGPRRGNRWEVVRRDSSLLRDEGLVMIYSFVLASGAGRG